MKSPIDNLDKDPEDYDSVREYIADCMEAGYTIEAEDFEGRPCSYCGELIDFVDWPDNVVIWDIRVHDPDKDEPEPYVARYYFCSEDCKQESCSDEDWLSGEGKYGEEDRLHIDEIDEGHTL